LIFAIADGSISKQSTCLGRRGRHRFSGGDRPRRAALRAYGGSSHPPGVATPLVAQAKRDGRARSSSSDSTTGREQPLPTNPFQRHGAAPFARGEGDGVPSAGPRSNRASARHRSGRVCWRSPASPTFPSRWRHPPGPRCSPGAPAVPPSVGVEGLRPVVIGVRAWVVASDIFGASRRAAATDPRASGRAAAKATIEQMAQSRAHSLCFVVQRNFKRVRLLALPRSLNVTQTTQYSAAPGATLAARLLQPDGPGPLMIVASEIRRAVSFALAVSRRRLHAPVARRSREGLPVSEWQGSRAPQP
jgi:hypothetical protein